MFNTSGDVVMFSLSMLTPYTEYSVSVQAVNSVLGEISEIVDFTTFEDGESISVFKCCLLTS